MTLCCYISCSFMALGQKQAYITHSAFEVDLQPSPYLCRTKLRPASLGGALLHGSLGQTEAGKAGCPPLPYSCPCR